MCVCVCGFFFFRNDNESTDKTVSEIETDAVLEARALLRPSDNDLQSAAFCLLNFFKKGFFLSLRF